jgi:uncharacterized membrane protein YedE/YeeE
MCCQHPRFTGFCAHFYNINFVKEQVLRRWYSSGSIMPSVLYLAAISFAAPVWFMKGCDDDVYARDHGSSDCIIYGYIFFFGQPDN